MSSVELDAFMATIPSLSRMMRITGLIGPQKTLVRVITVLGTLISSFVVFTGPFFEFQNGEKPFAELFHPANFFIPIGLIFAYRESVRFIDAHLGSLIKSVGFHKRKTLRRALGIPTTADKHTWVIQLSESVAESPLEEQEEMDSYTPGDQTSSSHFDEIPEFDTFIGLSLILKRGVTTISIIVVVFVIMVIFTGITSTAGDFAKVGTMLVPFMINAFTSFILLLFVNSKLLITQINEFRFEMAATAKYVKLAPIKKQIRWIEAVSTETSRIRAIMETYSIHSRAMTVVFGAFCIAGFLGETIISLLSNFNVGLVWSFIFLAQALTPLYFAASITGYYRRIGVDGLLVIGGAARVVQFDPQHNNAVEWFRDPTRGLYATYISSSGIEPTIYIADEEFEKDMALKQYLRALQSTVQDQLHHLGHDGGIKLWNTEITWLLLGKVLSLTGTGLAFLVSQTGAT